MFKRKLNDLRTWELHKFKITNILLSSLFLYLFNIQSFIYLQYTICVVYITLCEIEMNFLLFRTTANLVTKFLGPQETIPLIESLKRNTYSLFYSLIYSRHFRSLSM